MIIVIVKYLGCVGVYSVNNWYMCVCVCRQNTALYGHNEPHVCYYAACLMLVVSPLLPACGEKVSSPCRRASADESRKFIKEGTND